MIVTFIPEYLLKRYPFIDFVLLGNADYVIKDILERDNKLFLLPRHQKCLL